MKNLNDFYILIDIDSILWDYAWINEMKNSDPKVYSLFRPECITALNYLSFYINLKSKCKYIIGSSMAVNGNNLLKILKKEGLHNIKGAEFMQFGDRLYTRLKAVQTELKKRNCEDRFIIIDDEKYNYVPFINEKHIIETKAFESGISDKIVFNYLKTHNLIAQNNNEKHKAL